MLCIFNLLKMLLFLLVDPIFLHGMVQEPDAQKEESAPLIHQRQAAIKVQLSAKERVFFQEEIENFPKYATGEDLPPDMWRHIFSFLTTEEIRKNLVCWEWNILFQQGVGTFVLHERMIPYLRSLGEGLLRNGIPYAWPKPLDLLKRFPGLHTVIIKKRQSAHFSYEDVGLTLGESPQYHFCISLFDASSPLWLPGMPASQVKLKGMIDWKRLPAMPNLARLEVRSLAETTAREVDHFIGRGYRGLSCLEFNLQNTSESAKQLKATKFYQNKFPRLQIVYRITNNRGLPLPLHEAVDFLGTQSFGDCLIRTHERMYTCFINLTSLTQVEDAQERLREASIWEGDQGKEIIRFVFFFTRTNRSYSMQAVRRLRTHLIAQRSMRGKLWSFHTLKSTPASVEITSEEELDEALEWVKEKKFSPFYFCGDLLSLPEIRTKRNELWTFQTRYFGPEILRTHVGIPKSWEGLYTFLCTVNQEILEGVHQFLDSKYPGFIHALRKWVDHRGSSEQRAWVGTIDWQRFPVAPQFKRVNLKDKQTWCYKALRSSLGNSPVSEIRVDSFSVKHSEEESIEKFDQDFVAVLKEGFRQREAQGLDPCRVILRECTLDLKTYNWQRGPLQLSFSDFVTLSSLTLENCSVDGGDDLRSSKVFAFLAQFKQVEELNLSIKSNFLVPLAEDPFYRKFFIQLQNPSFFSNLKKLNLQLGREGHSEPHDCCVRDNICTRIGENDYLGCCCRVSCIPVRCMAIPLCGCAICLEGLCDICSIYRSHHGYAPYACNFWGRDFLGCGDLMRDLFCCVCQPLNKDTRFKERDIPFLEDLISSRPNLDIVQISGVSWKYTRTSAPPFSLLERHGSVKFSSHATPDFQWTRTLSANLPVGGSQEARPIGLGVVERYPTTYSMGSER